jgi:CDP-4-dehydro-6-deoxyglucose reductase
LYAPEVVQKWLRQRPSLRYEPVISDPVDTGVWSGRRGLVHQAVLDAIDSVQDFDVYVCGAPVMVQAVREVLVGQRRLPSAQFFSDSFVVDSPAATA